MWNSSSPEYLLFAFPKYDNSALSLNSVCRYKWVRACRGGDWSGWDVEGHLQWSYLVGLALSWSFQMELWGGQGGLTVTSVTSLTSRGWLSWSGWLSRCPHPPSLCQVCPSWNCALSQRGRPSPHWHLGQKWVNICTPLLEPSNKSPRFMMLWGILHFLLTCGSLRMSKAMTGILSCVIWERMVLGSLFLLWREAVDWESKW